MRRARMWCLCAAVLLIAAALPLATSQQQSRERNDERHLKQIFPNDTRIDRLKTGRPINGTLELAALEMLAFSAPKRDDFGFPDVLLTLDVTNLGGDADLFCLPFILSVTGAFAAPLPGNAVWQSLHTQGQDYVFISRNHSSYLDSVQTVDDNGTMVEQTNIVCSIIGLSPTPTDYRLFLDLDYASRELIEEERAAVRSIFNKCCLDEGSCLGWRRISTFIEGGAQSSVNSDLPVLDMCHVHGSFCDEQGRLRRLNMNDFGLSCPFPANELSKMTQMEKILLSINSLTGDVGDIVEELSVLPKIDQLTARRNMITGNLSDDRVCSFVSGTIEFLDLEENLIEGPLSACLFNRSSNLLELHLDGNNLGSTIPDAFDRDASLQVLSLSNTSLTGSLPDSMQQLLSLQSLDLRSNSLTGPLPEDIGLSPFLHSVRLQHNLLTGEVPASIFTSNVIRDIILDNNTFTSLPRVLSINGSVGASLRSCGLSLNNFTGELPIALATAPNLTMIDLRRNNFSGPLPAVNGLFPKTWFINLSNNQLSGSIPDEWQTIGIFTGSALLQANTFPVLDLSNNSLSGDLPDFLLDVQKLPIPVFIARSVHIGGNMFECPTNASVSHLRGMEECASQTSGGGESSEGSDTISAIPTVPVGTEDEEESDETTSTEAEGGTQEESPEQTPEETIVNVPSANVENPIPVAVQSTEDGITSEAETEASDGSDASLSTGAGIGIGVVAVVVVLAASSVIIFLYVRRRRQSKASATTAPEETPDPEFGQRKANMKFEKYEDESAEVQMFVGDKSTDIDAK